MAPRDPGIISSDDSEEQALYGFVRALVADFLREHEFKQTLGAFMEEEKSLRLAPATIDTWYELSNRLDIPELIRGNNLPGGEGHRSIVEVLCQHTLSLKDASRRLRNNVTVTVTSPLIGHQLNSSGGVSGSRTGNVVHLQQQHGADRPRLEPPRPPSTAPAGMGRPSSLVPVSAGAPVSRNLRSAGGRTSNSGLGAGRGGVRIVDWRSGDSSGGGSSSHRGGKRHTKGKSRSFSTLPHSTMRSGLGSVGSDDDGGGAGGTTKRSAENWIPTAARLRMLRRGMTATRLNLSARQRVLQESARFEAQEESALEHEKRREHMLGKKGKECALCEHAFALVALPMAISYKAVLDLRASWEAKLGRPHVLPNVLLARPPRCYDEVRVCVFCSQLFQDDDTYRPSKRAQASAEAASVAEAEEERARVRRDPLLRGQRTRDELLALHEEQALNKHGLDGAVSQGFSRRRLVDRMRRAEDVKRGIRAAGANSSSPRASSANPDFTV